MENNKAIFFMHAYNADKFLCRAVDSILNQTEQSFTLFLLDNGSLDSTREIITEYAKKDTRVIPLLKDKNHMLEPDKASPIFEFLRSLFSSKWNGGNYFSMLDADDEYAPDFLEKMLKFTQGNNLDISACRSDFINAETGEKLNKIILNDNIIVSQNEFGEKFPEYFRYVGSLWGKLISMSLWNKLDFDKCISMCANLAYSTDTAISFELLKLASRVGILAEPMHKYYIYKTSSSSDFPIKRYEANYIMIDIYKAFLMEKVSYISTDNASYICGIYLRSIQNTSQIVFYADWTLEKKLSVISDAVNNELTLEILNRADSPSSDKLGLSKCILDWISLQDIDVRLNKLVGKINYVLERYV